MIDEWVSKLTLKRNSGKSVLVTDEVTWSDGTVKYPEARFKKEDLFDKLYALELEEAAK